MTGSINHTERGAALFLAIGLLAVLTALSATFYAGIHRQLRACHLDEAHTEALHIAEGGIHFAIAQLEADASFRGTDNVALGDGQFNVTVKPGEEPSTYRVDASGVPSREPNEARTVHIEAIVQIADDSPAVLLWKRIPKGEL